MLRKRSPEEKKKGKVLIGLGVLGVPFGGMLLEVSGIGFYGPAHWVVAGILAVVVMRGLQLCASEMFNRLFFMSPEDEEKAEEKKEEKEASA